MNDISADLYFPKRPDPTVCEVCGKLADGEPRRCHLHFRRAGRTDEYAYATEGATTSDQQLRAALDEACAGENAHYVNGFNAGMAFAKLWSRGLDELKAVADRIDSYCDHCGGDRWILTADPNESGEPSEPYQVACLDSLHACAEQVRGIAR